MSADRALQAGFVNQVFDTKETLLIEARKLVHRIASLSPLVIQSSKLVVNHAEEHTLEEGLHFVALWNSAFLKSDDLTEAFSAFLGKREPVFKARL